MQLYLVVGLRHYDEKRTLWVRCQWTTVVGMNRASNSYYKHIQVVRMDQCSSDAGHDAKFRQHPTQKEQN